MDYLVGLNELRLGLKEASPKVTLEFHVLEARLRENLSREGRYGTNENIRSERAEIIEQLNILTTKSLDISFNELCPPDRISSAILTAPPLPSYYVERTVVMDRVRSALVDGDSASGAPIAILGMSGVGKTVLAVALAHDRAVREAFRHGVLWAKLGPHSCSAEDVKRWLLAWAANLEMDLHPTLAVETLTSMLTNALSRKKCLLVLDDVWSAVPAAMLLNLRGSRCGAVLTTREEDIAVSLGATSFGLDTLSTSEAKLLIELSLIHI